VIRPSSTFKTSYPGAAKDLLSLCPSPAVYPPSTPPEHLSSTTLAWFLPPSFFHYPFSRILSMLYLSFVLVVLVVVLVHLASTFRSHPSIVLLFLLLFLVVRFLLVLASRDSAKNFFDGNDLFAGLK